MWRAVDAAGQLKYPNFVEIVNQLDPFYWLRVAGGALYLVGALMLAVNIAMTMRRPHVAAA